MHTFYIELAGRCVRITCNYQETKRFCKEYLTENTEAQITVCVTLSDLAVEREKAEKEYGKEAGRFSNAYLEVLAVYRQIAAQMPKYDTFLFHGSAIAVDGEAYLFTAPSGTGKSTHARLWREYFGERAYMINDDKPLIQMMDDGRVLVHGTPWNGKHNLSTKVAVPLKGICVLSQGKENKIRKLTSTESFPMIYQQTYRPIEKGEVIKKTLTLLDQFMKQPIWHLECNISEEAVLLAYHTMSTNNKTGEES